MDGLEGLGAEGGVNNRDTQGPNPTAEDDEVRLGNQGGGSGGNTRNQLEADWERAYELDGDHRT